MAHQTNNDHWLTQVRCVPSANCNQRPPNTEISLLVIHNISLPAGDFGGESVQELFTNCLDCNSHPEFKDLQGLEVSPHLYINRQGEVIQFVALNQRAWHAGVSVYKGREACNDFSIGIELEGTDDCPYTQQQYWTLLQLTRQIMTDYPAIATSSIVGHSDISPGRKTDPGPAFDWGYFKAQLNQPTDLGG